jgi:hypothetical protein
MVDLNIRIADIVQVFTLLVSVSVIVWRVMHVVTKVEALGQTLQTQVADLKRAVADNLTLVNNEVAELNRKLQAFDAIYLRKEVFDAKWALLHEKLEPVRMLSQRLLDMVVAVPTRKKR